jgi:organic radical activating enzyme
MSTNKVFYLTEIKQRLDSVSPTMCLAKWTQTTLHLNTGHTHSCHHPISHKVPLESLVNPLNLHNTQTKILARQEMLDGKQTKECDYCWKIENLENSHYSDRHMKSAAKWSVELFDKIIESKTGENFFPSYVEVNFESTCNFRCLYCSPEISSRWMEDAQKGPYHLPNQTYNNINYLEKVGKIPYLNREHNPYVEAFWKLWPELKENLMEFRITGGEPLLSKNTWSIMEDLISKPRPKLKFSINTNLCVPEKQIEKFISNINSLIDLGYDITVFTSAEGDGPEQEFVRDGMIMSMFWKNVELILSQTQAKLVYMTTVNVFSCNTFTQFLDKCVSQRLEFGQTRVGISINYLRHPNFLSLGALREDSKNKVLLNWKTWISLVGGSKLHDWELESFERIISWLSEQKYDSKLSDDLESFIFQVCKRRDLNTKVASWVLENT